MNSPHWNRAPRWHSLAAFGRRHAFFLGHFAWFALVSLTSGLVMYLIEQDRFSYLDMLYTAVSAVCVTGLIAVDTSVLRAGTQVTIMFTILLGSTVLNSSVPPLIRLLSWTSNCRRHGISLRQLQRKAQVEYAALCGFVLLPLLFSLTVHLLAFVALVSYMAVPSGGGNVLDSAQPASPGTNVVFFSLFHAVSAFQNAGFSTLQLNLVPMAKQPYFLLVTMQLILLGNTCYPIVLFLMLRAASWAVRWRHALSFPAEVLDFMLHKPRACFFYYLFPWKQTLLLAGTVCGINMFQIVAFLAVEWRSPALSGLGTGNKLLNAVFITLSTRTTGFNTFDLSLQTVSTQALQILFMYVASYPLIVSMSAVGYGQPRLASVLSMPQELVERSLAQKYATRPSTSWKDGNHDVVSTHSAHLSGLTTSRSLLDKEEPNGVSSPELLLDLWQAASHLERERHPRTSSSHSISSESTDYATSHQGPLMSSSAPDSDWSQTRRSITSNAHWIAFRDLWLLFAVFWLVAMLETTPLRNKPGFSPWKIIYEISSSYGTVGLSLGYPDNVTSFSAQWRPLSKLLLMLVMLFGRHRGLPQSVERITHRQLEASAALLPEAMLPRPPPPSPAGSRRSFASEGSRNFSIEMESFGDGTSVRSDSKQSGMIP